LHGRAALTVATLTMGSHSLTAVYSGGGSGNFLASTSAAVTQVVNGPTTASLTSTPNPSVSGQTVTLSTTVSPVPPATGVPTGTVTFKDGATSLGTVTLINGSASLTISTLALGSHSLTAAYNGAGNFLTSTSAAVTHTVVAPTTVAMTSAPSPSLIGQTVTLSATVSPVPPATGVPTGTLTFRDRATSLGTATLVNGTASLAISTLTLGSHSLTVAYSGDAAFASSTSAAVTQVVNTPTTTSLISTPNPSAINQTV